MARKKAAMSNDVAKALARLSSGLYIVTAAHNGAQGAMVGANPAFCILDLCRIVLYIV